MRNPRVQIMVMLISLFLLTGESQAQEDLLALLEEEQVDTKEFVTAAFKTSRIINGHSIENTPRNILDIKISHRFGFINNGFYDIFGLDGATIRIGGDWGVTDRLTIGGGRSSLEKTYDFYGKYLLLRQSRGKKSFPFSMSYLGTAAINTLRIEDPNAVNFFQSRLFYSHEILIARKFSEGFSLQLTPVVVHRNIVKTHGEQNDVLSLGFGARQKVSKRVSINLEYFYVFPDQIDPRYKNSLSIGCDIETGGHVFQLHFTNSTSMISKGYLTESTGDWSQGEIHFGFNVSRVFNVGKGKH